MKDQPQTVPITKNGSLKTSKEEPVNDPGLKEPIYSDEHTFLVAIGRARQYGQESVLVTQEFFDYLSMGQRTPYRIHNGIKVYVEGTRDKWEKFDEMKLDDRAAAIHNPEFQY